MPETRSRPASYFIFFAAFALILFLIHAAFLTLPYFWDELGQFIPAALDIYHDGAWVPHSTVPNAHAPGVMAYLAAVWKLFGYSIPATRAAMLTLGSCTLLVTFLLAIHLCGGLSGAPALIPVLLLFVDPLFYMQSMLAQLDMPAMLCTALALLLFLQDRHRAAALACVALVLAKETGAMLPLIFGATLLLDRDRAKYAVYYAAPFAVLAVWFFVLWRTTGHLFGDAGFTHYNLGYALHPVRAAMCFVRRIFYLFIDDFRFVGTIAMVRAWKKTKIYSTRGWRITWAFIAGHVLMVSLIGGAELERYLLPVIPLVYIAMAAGFSTFRPVWKNAAVIAMTAGLLAGLFINPPYPFPLENNLGMVDFVELQRSAAQFVEKAYASKSIYSAWPFTQALRDPAFGYVDREMKAVETSDFRYSVLQKLDPNGADVLVMYSRTWEPKWGVLRLPLVVKFLSHFYEYEPQMTAEQVREHFGMVPVRRWERRGQWAEVYARY